MIRPDRIFEDPQRKKTFKGVAYALMALFIAVDFIMPRHHAPFFWDEIPGFSSVFGLAACVLIIAVSKVLGKFWLHKKEDYYD